MVENDFALLRDGRYPFPFLMTNSTGAPCPWGRWGHTFIGGFIGLPHPFIGGLLADRYRGIQVDFFLGGSHGRRLHCLAMPGEYMACYRLAMIIIGNGF